MVDKTNKQIKPNQQQKNHPHHTTTFQLTEKTERQ